MELLQLAIALQLVAEVMISPTVAQVVEFAHVEFAHVLLVWVEIIVNLLLIVLALSMATTRSTCVENATQLISLALIVKEYHLV